MSVATDIQGLAKVCQVGAHEVLEAILELGPRPIEPQAAVLLWDQTHTRLKGQMNSLTALASKLSSGAVIAALEDAKDEVAALQGVTKKAKARIESIKDTSALLSTLARVLDVGLAVLALATAPSPATAAALANKIKELVKDLQP